MNPVAKYSGKFNKAVTHRDRKNDYKRKAKHSKKGDEMSDTYWAGKGKYPNTQQALHALIPCMGSVERPYKNKMLERYRKACNKYYRLYNDGDFNIGAARIFKIEQPSMYRYPRWMNGRSFRDEFYTLVEDAINTIIEAAAQEQGIELS